MPLLPDHCKEGARHPDGGDGYVETVWQFDAEAGTAGSHPVRQVPRAAPSECGAGWGQKERICAAGGTRPSLQQGTEIHLAGQSGEPDAGWQASLEEIAGRQHTAEHGAAQFR